MSVQVVTNSQAGNFVLDGAYIDLITAQQVLPQGPQSNLIGIVGAASWGPKNVPTAFSGGGAASVSNVFGAKTSNVKSLVREALSAQMGGGSNFLGVRVSDGTDAAATMLLKDASAGTVLTLTAVYTGTYPNNAAWIRVDLVSGTASANPIYQISVGFPGVPTQVWTNVPGYSTPGAYSSTAFIANALAAINGTGAGRIASPYFVASGGSSTIAPVAATAVFATGGLDGDTGVTDSTTIGTDAGPSSTGMYCLRSQLAGAQIVLADFTTATSFGAVALFCLQELAFGWEAFPSGTTTTSAAATKITDSMSDPNMGLLLDWVETYDQYQAANILVSPIGVAAGIVAALNAWQDPGNHPTVGAPGIITTDRLTLGAISNAELGQRESNGIDWIGNTPNGVKGLFHGLTSAGGQISDSRMQHYLAVQIGAVLAQYVGKLLETTIPFAQADENDPRVQAYAALTALLQPMVTPGSRQISAYQVIINDSNNTTTSMQQGFLIAAVNVTTLTGVRFAVGMVQVGNTVAIATSSQPVAG